MTDPRRDTIARVLHDRICTCPEKGRPPRHMERHYAEADAVLAALSTYEQVGWRSESGLFYTDAQREKYPLVPVVPVYIVREDTAPTVPCDLCDGLGFVAAPCPRRCTPEGAQP